MNDLAIGTELPVLRVRPSAITLFRFSAVTWNPHRIHYDEAYAKTEGYGGVLVQGHLHGAWMLAAVSRWVGERGRTEQFSWQNRHFAVPGDELTILGHVAELDGDLLTIDLIERNQDDATCARGRAILRLKVGMGRRW